MLGFELAGDRVHFEPGVFERHATLDASNWEDPRMPASVLRQRGGPGAERHVDIRRLKELEAAGHDAHDGVGLVVELQRAPERLSTRELALGEGGAQERHTLRALDGRPSR